MLGLTVFQNQETVHYLWEGGGMGEKMGGPEILATAKRGVLGKFFVIEEGVLKF